MVEPGRKPRFSDLNPCFFFFFFFFFYQYHAIQSACHYGKIQYDRTIYFLFYISKIGTETEQKSTSIIINTMETYGIGLLLVCVLALAGREFNLISVWEKQHIQPKGCGLHRNELCFKGARIARGNADEDNINTCSLSNCSVIYCGYCILLCKYIIYDPIQGGFLEAVLQLTAIGFQLNLIHPFHITLCYRISRCL